MEESLHVLHMAKLDQVRPLRCKVYKNRLLKIFTVFSVYLYNMLILYQMNDTKFKAKKLTFCVTFFEIYGGRYNISL